MGTQILQWSNWAPVEMQSQCNLMSAFECAACNRNQIMKLEGRLTAVYCITLQKNIFPDSGASGTASRACRSCYWLMWISVWSGGPEEFWMSGKNTGHKRISILNHGCDLCGSVNSEKHTDTHWHAGSSHTQGNVQKKHWVSRRSACSHVSQAEAPDSETNTTWHRGKEKSIYTHGEGWRLDTGDQHWGWMDRWRRGATGQIRGEGKRNNKYKLGQLQKAHLTMDEGHASSQSSWEKWRWSWRRRWLWWNGAPGPVTLQGLVSSQYGFVSQ